MKPWAKYEVGFINHDKFRAITPNAICLWLEGKNYADDKHTDGLLPEYEVKHWRFYSKKSVALLTTSVGLNPRTDQVYFPLWDAVEGFGFKMHDYLDHNDCKEEVQARIGKADEDRKRRATNQKEWRERQKEDRRQAALLENAITEPITGESRSAIVTDRQNTDNRIQNQKQNSLSERESFTPVTAAQALGAEKRLEPLPPLPSDELSDRAGRLVERYAELFYQHRRGARYRSQLHFDVQKAFELVAIWPDDAHLEKLAILVLTTDDPYISTTDRSFSIFARKASWADDRYRQWEAKQGVSA